MLSLVGLKDDYAHDGRVLFEVLDDNALPSRLDGQKEILTRLAHAYKSINAPVGKLGRLTFPISTAALNGDDATYTRLENRLNNLTDERNTIAQKMIILLEGAVFENKAVNEREAALLILEADALIASTAVW